MFNALTNLFKSVLQHPNIFWFNTVLCLFNFVCLVICLVVDFTPGIIINAAFLIVNSVAARGNFLLREYRMELRRTAHKPIAH